MKIIEVAQELMKFRTETGNTKEINEAMSYIKNMMTLIGAKVDIFTKKDTAPVIFIRNKNSLDLDALVLGHIDVVPAEDKMFKPVVKGGKLYGRGSLDMKSFAAVALNSMQYVIEHKLPLKFGVILSSDEEKGSKGTKAFLEKYAKIKADVVLDNDVGGDITKLIVKCKNPVFVKIKTHGKEAHGSLPWDGIDANELMLILTMLFPQPSTKAPIAMPQNITLLALQSDAMAAIISFLVLHLATSQRLSLILAIMMALMKSPPM